MASTRRMAVVLLLASACTLAGGAAASTTRPTTTGPPTTSSGAKSKVFAPKVPKLPKITMPSLPKTKAKTAGDGGRAAGGKPATKVASTSSAPRVVKVPKGIDMKKLTGMQKAMDLSDTLKRQLKEKVPSGAAAQPSQKPAAARKTPQVSAGSSVLKGLLPKMPPLPSFVGMGKKAIDAQKVPLTPPKLPRFAPPTMKGLPQGFAPPKIGGGILAPPKSGRSIIEDLQAGAAMFGKVAPSKQQPRQLGKFSSAPFQKGGSPFPAEKFRQASKRPRGKSSSFSAPRIPKMTSFKLPRLPFGFGGAKKRSEI